MKACPTVPLAVLALVITGAMTLPVFELRGLGAPEVKSAELSPVSADPPLPRKTARVEEPAGAGPDPS